MLLVHTGTLLSRLSKQRAGKQQVCVLHFQVENQAPLPCAAGTDSPAPVRTVPLAAVLTARTSPCPPLCLSSSTFAVQKNGVLGISKKVRAAHAHMRLYQRCQLGGINLFSARALQAMPGHCSFSGGLQPSLCWIKLIHGITKCNK